MLLASISAAGIGTKMPTVPSQAIELIKEFEGLRLKPYHDATGNLTIGYGTRINHPIGILTQEEAEQLLEQAASDAMKAINRLTYVPLSIGQYTALIDFVYNLGSGTYQRSTLRMKLNRGEYNAAAQELTRWIYAGPRILPGLVRRRQREYHLFHSIIPSPSEPK